ncbi:DUF6460 domain-containing protein [Camelimonas abortus]|uniref:DUF6460 domain-containing protein n=1 Tax=Camelimonas abortus TaxID=1017184 RepID=A0ABV7LCZ2_9HYPH
MAGSRGGLNGFLGGSPLSVLARLAFLSLLVGAAMAFLDITPVALVDGAVRFARRLVANGFAVLGDLGMWMACGAMVVVPVWLALRLLARRG